jgi:hypothetical protein
MTQCGTCSNYTLHFPSTVKSAYYREAQIGRCTLESAAKVRSPAFEHECSRYKAAENMEQRINWMRTRK